MKKILLILGILILPITVIGNGNDDEVFGEINKDLEEMYRIETFYLGYYKNALDFVERWPIVEDRPSNHLRKYRSLLEYGDIAQEMLLDVVFYENYHRVTQQINTFYEALVAQNKSGLSKGQISTLVDQEIDKSSLSKEDKEFLKYHDKRQEKFKELKSNLEKNLKPRKGKKPELSDASSKALDEWAACLDLKALGLEGTDPKEFSGKKSSKKGKGKPPTQDKPAPATASRPSTPPSSSGASAAGSSQGARPKASKGATAKPKSPREAVESSKFRGFSTCILAGNPPKHLRHIADKAKLKLEKIKTTDSIGDIKSWFRADFKKLSGSNWYSIKIDKQYRIIFQYDERSRGDKIHNVRVLDYHRGHKSK
ncbi:MAG: hypothetical protein DRQ88_00845 [Epsilonproteobacteria bacterium]|nr:MAG: hypothetical protein DRQ89_11030 [Campylobacterota bacterium]RLA68182.1 MAG: hypothetical protein DRQ88_00845 [Campylobacterota bacterium]